MPLSQLQMCQNADRKVLDKCKVFNEIMTGPNPLTPAEVRKLIDRHPDRYTLFEKWATPREAQICSSEIEPPS